VPLKEVLISLKQIFWHRRKLVLALHDNGREFRL